MAKEVPDFGTPIVVPDFGTTVEVPEFGTTVEVPDFGSPVEVPEFGTPVEQDEVTLGEFGAGLAADVAISTAGQAAGAATGIGYIPIAFASGVAGSMAAQQIEGQDDFSWGRAFAGGILNLIPGGKAIQGTAKVATKLGGKAAGEAFEKSTQAVARKIGQNTTETIAQGVVGSGLGTTGVSIEKIIDDGRLPTLQEFATTAAGGFILGSSLDVSGRAIKKALGKFGGKTFAEINDMVESGDVTAAQLEDLNIIHRGNPQSRQVRFENLLAKFQPNRVIGKKASERIFEFEQAKEAGISVGRKIQRSINTALKNLPKEQQEEGQQLFRDIQDGIRPIDDLETAFDGKLKDARQAMKSFQDINSRNSKAILRLDDEETFLTMNQRDTLEENELTYVNRQYDAFQDENYIFNKDLLDTAIEKLTKTVNHATGENYKREDIIEQVRGWHETIADRKLKRSFSPEERAQNNALMSRSQMLNDSPELRKYLGEVMEPGRRAAMTLDTQSRIIATRESDRSIRDILVSSGFAKTRQQLETEGADTANRFSELKLRTIRQKGKSPDDLMIPNEMNAALGRLYMNNMDKASSNAMQSALANAFSDSVALSKAVKTVLNFPSHSIQFISNPFLMLDLAVDPRRFGQNILVGASDINFYGSKTVDEFADKLVKSLGGYKMLELYRKYGLIGTTAEIEDITRNLQGGKIGKIASRVIDPFARVYQIADVATRVGIWKHFRKLFSRSMGIDMIDADADTREAVERLAARVTNNVFLNYDKINPNMRTLSKYGLMNQFAAFTVELIRTQYNQGKLIKGLLDGSFAREIGQDLVNPEVLRNQGMKMLMAKILTYSSVTGGLVAFNRTVGGVSEEEEKALRESVLPSWDRQRPLSIVKRGDNIYTTAASYTVPQAQLIAPFLSGLRAENPKEALGTSMKAFFEDIIGEGSFVMNGLTAAVHGRDLQTGQPISSSPNEIRQMMDRAGFFIAETFTPGVIREIERLEVLTPNKEKSRSLAEFYMRQAGVRVNRTSIEKGISFQLRDNTQGIIDTQSQYARVRRALGNAPDRLEQQYQILNKNYQQHTALIANHVKNLKTLGKTEEEIVAMMRERRVSGKVILNALLGRPTSMPRRDAENPTTALHRIQSLPENEVREELSKMSNPLRRAVERKMKAEEQRRSKGISPTDSILLSFGVADNERAKMILELMPEKGGEAYLNELSRKGIATKEVVKSIRMLQSAGIYQLDN